VEAGAGAALGEEAEQTTTEGARGTPSVEFDLEALLACGGDAPDDLSVPLPGEPPISPQGAVEAAERLHSSIRQALDSTMSCERLLHELEQEFNLA